MTSFSFSVFQIVGFKNSGKTTLVTKLIKDLVKEDYRVGSLKHHGHGGYPDISDQGTDSYQHRQAGAIVSGVEGEGLFQLHMEAENNQVETLLQFYKHAALDCVLVEGYKQALYPKVVLIRQQEDLELLKVCSQIEAVITWDKKLMKQMEHFPSFHISEEDKYIPYLISHVKRRLS